MKEKILILLGFVVFNLVMFLVPANAETRFNDDFLELNAKQSKVLQKIEEVVKDNSYPTYFGGVYISDDSTHIVLQIVEGNIPNAENLEEYSTFNQIKNMDSNVEIEYVKYSYRELNAINDALVKYFSFDKANLTNLSAHYVDTFKNVVVIELIDNNLKQIDAFKELVFGREDFKKLAISSYVIEFTKGKNEDQALKAGEKISVTDGHCSMGYRVKINGDKGYITAGHCFDGVGDNATGGTVERYRHSGDVDAAFVKTNILTFPSNALQYTSGSITTLNNTLCPTLSLNQAIAKSGYKTGYTSGQIKNLNYSANYSGEYFTGLIATNYSSGSGDSGGAVFVPTNVSGGAPLAGIHKGTSSYGAAFVNADKIYLAFGYERY